MMKDGFKVELDDFAKNQIGQLEIFQTNLNKNPNNKTALEEFVQATSEVKTNLKDRYGDSWADPASTNEDADLTKQQSTEETQKNLQKRFMTSEYEEVDPTPESEKEAEEE